MEPDIQQSIAIALKAASSLPATADTGEQLANSEYHSKIIKRCMNDQENSMPSNAKNVEYKRKRSLKAFST